MNDGPMTREEMATHIRWHAEAQGLVDPALGEFFAERAVDELIRQQAVSEWGMNEYGEILYEPTVERAVIYIRR